VKDNEIIARAIADLNPDATVLVVTDRGGHQFVIAYGGISGDVPAMYRRRGYKVTPLTELEAAS
jgi:hypothetical protein